MNFDHTEYQNTIVPEFFLCVFQTKKLSIMWHRFTSFHGEIDRWYEIDPIWHSFYELFNCAIM